MAANSGPVGHLLRAMWFLLAVYCCSGQSGKRLNTCWIGAMGGLLGQFF